MTALWALLLGYGLDLLFGDPHWLPHPVVLMGKCIAGLEKGLRRLLPDTPGGQLAGGAVLALVLPLGSFGLAYLLLWCCGLVHPGFRLAVESFLCYQVLATKSLRVESMKVYWELEKGDLPAARQAVGRIVGRDTQALTAEGVTKAAVETVAENTGDGVVAPMVFLALGGAPLGLLYKAINTMDSMVGYRNERYLYFGRVPARLDDAAELHTGPAGGPADGAGRLAAAPYGRPRRLADLPPGPVPAQKPQFRPDRGGGCRRPGRPAGRRCLLLWQAGAQAHHRRPGAAGGGRRTSHGPAGFCI